MKYRGLIVTLIVAVLTAPAAAADAAKGVGELMTSLHARGQFNGNVLVAVNGEVIYRGSFGSAAFESGIDLTPETPSCIASCAKQFTSMAIMMLAEQGKLGIDDSISKYIPELSGYRNQITIRHLLTHTSGIPDYGNLGIDGDMSGNDVAVKAIARAVLKQQSALLKPGQKFQYSNPGYVLLAVIVEQVSGKSFADFLQLSIFTPLGMDKTFVYDSPKHRGKTIAKGYDQFGKPDGVVTSFTTGDGNIYSTVDDLFKWDQALYTEKLVRQSTLAQAFTPGIVEEDKSNYGFGWNVGGTGDDKFVWHTGSTGGYRAFIERRLKDKITVIMLTNRGDSKRRDINDAIGNILTNKPYTLPKLPIAERLHNEIKRSGIQSALRMYDSMKHDPDAAYDLSESDLNILGYQLLYSDDRVRDAVEIFKLNAAEHPTSSNAFDSLGEAYLRGGDKRLAVESYESAVKLDAANLHAADQLKAIK